MTPGMRGSWSQAGGRHDCFPAGSLTTLPAADQTLGEQESLMVNLPGRAVCKLETAELRLASGSGERMGALMTPPSDMLPGSVVGGVEAPPAMLSSCSSDRTTPSDWECCLRVLLSDTMVHSFVLRSVRECYGACGCAAGCSGALCRLVSGMVLLRLTGRLHCLSQAGNTGRCCSFFRLCKCFPWRGPRRNWSGRHFP